MQLRAVCCCNMWAIKSLLVFLGISVLPNTVLSVESQWSYACENGKCRQIQTTPDRHSQLSTCQITCGDHGALWPHPRGKSTIGNYTLPIQPWNIKKPEINVEDRQQSKEATQLLQGAYDIFYKRLSKIHSRHQGDTRGPSRCTSPVWENKLTVKMDVKSSLTKLTLATDESYKLAINANGANIKTVITANNFFGARHGLATLGQLFAYDHVCRALQIVAHAAVEDSPAYPLRGLLLDTSRNFFSVESILSVIDGMALNKLNTFHWHITDTHSFPIFVRHQPEMTRYGAYSRHHIYTQSDVDRIVQYAAVRGVRVMPEFDQPAHCGNGWQWGPKKNKGKLAVCVNQEPWQSVCVEPPCGQLNPLNNNVYDVLGNIYKSYLEMFDSDLFHLGGDEVNVNCWNTTSEIIKWMEENGKKRTEKDFMDLWKIFLDKTAQKFKEANNNVEKPMMLWTSHMTFPKYLERYIDKSKYIIQIWTERSNKDIANLVNKGFRVVFSNYDGVYLDCGFGGWVADGSNWCSPYKEWQKLYDNDPKEILADFGITDPAKQKLVLGGEAAMWSEQVDEQSVSMKIWPRTAAYAERLWSEPKITWRQAEPRFLRHRERLVQHGIKADALQPLWCVQNEGKCFV